MSPTDPAKEELLAQRAAAGDRQAYRSIYDLHVRALYAVCARYIASDEDAKDVIQESFLKIFASIGSFRYRGEGSLRGWMKRIVINEALKAIKLKGRLDFTDLDSAGDPADTDEPADDLSPDTIFRLIRELPDGYRTIFNLYVIEHRTHKEISSLLGIKESTSASQLHRAKAMLAAKLRHTINSQR